MAGLWCAASCFAARREAEAGRLRHGNERLKKVVARHAPDIEVLKEINAKNW